jgi:hypothetical protein
MKFVENNIYYKKNNIFEALRILNSISLMLYFIIIIPNIIMTIILRFDTMIREPKIMTRPVLMLNIILNLSFYIRFML